MPPIRNLTGHSTPSEEGSAASLLNPFGSDADNGVSENDEFELHNFDESSPQDSSSLEYTAKDPDLKLRPNEYDRYPSYLNSMRSVSSSRQSLIQSTPQPGNSNPFLNIDPDFSPFGGYPLSSFPLNIEEKESDDYLHNPDPILDLEYDKNRFWHDIKNGDRRSISGLIGLIFLAVGAVALFVVLPVLTYSGVHLSRPPVLLETYTVLTEYEYPQLSAIRTSLVDPDSPDSAKTREARDGSLWQLVFSDEFNAEGRTFYPGDDQFWYGPDLNYAATLDLEWYDPDAISTANGTLELRLDAIPQHNLFYRSGMLNSWNKMCFTQGIMEVGINLPNKGNVSGLWPGLWSLGNLARPGYLATTLGTWPYSYEGCDAGITPNQSSPDGISYLPGQKLNACTCPNEDHPNAGVGRGAPEIDIIEIESDTNLKIGVASQSLQLAPMDIWYMPDYSFVEIYNDSVSTMNTYAGGPYQQAVSATTTLNPAWYEKTGGEYQKYAFEYLNDDDNGYIRWFVGDDPTLTMHAYALAPNGNIDWRRISKEPMSMILNLGMSNNWAYIDWNAIEFPSIMRVDYVRVYQPNDSISLTCDPEGYPTYDYIQSHLNAYEDYNLTTWELAGYSFPKHKLNGC